MTALLSKKKKTSNRSKFSDTHRVVQRQASADPLAAATAAPPQHNTVNLGPLKTEHIPEIPPPLRDPDLRRALPGRGHPAHHGRGGLRLRGLAAVPGAHRRLPGALALLGRRQGRLGLHVEVDQRLLHRAHGRRVLPPLLQRAVHGVAQPAAAQDRRAEPELRGHPDELPGRARDAPPAGQGHAAQAVQGAGGSWRMVALERPGPLRAAADVSEYFRPGFRVHAAAAVQFAAGSRAF